MTTLRHGIEGPGDHRTFRHLAEAGEAYLKPQPIPGLPAQIIYESVGPIFSVQPWNVPFWQVLRFSNTTALVGNTALIKHAETLR
jgi:acyl-CoA reductase-like NAD-dependent aldehyde dehydrogenase